MSLTWEPAELPDERPDDSLWIIYALGGGTGHWIRAISLARQAARHGIATRILTNSPCRFLCRLAPIQDRERVRSLIRLDPKIEIIVIPATYDREQISEIIGREISACRVQDVLIVDSFPSGLGGELRDRLRDISGYKVFIHRDLKPEYIRWGHLEEVVSLYNLVISPGESGPLDHLVHARTNPWLICESEELVPRAKARKMFGMDENNRLPLIVVSGCGTSDESFDMARCAFRLHREFGKACQVRMASLDENAVCEAGELGVSLWPLFAVLPGVDLLVGAAGYHTVYETRVTQTPLFAIPRNRLYDRQSHRILDTERVVSDAELTDKIGKFLMQYRVSKTEFPPPYHNGAAEAFEIIAASHSC